MNLNKQDIDKFYVSEHDVFLHEFDKENPVRTKSQQQEIDKHAKLHHKRDGSASPKKSSLLRKVFRVLK